MAYQSFEDLEVWQRGCRLSLSMFKIFDRCKNFTLRDQVQRAGLSIPCNIAEGAERGSTAMLEGLRRSVLNKARAKQKRARRRRSTLNT